MGKDFKLLLAGQLISQVGDKFHMIALAFWVLETTGSSGKMGLVLAASLVPGLIAGLFSGSVIDRNSKKHIIVGTDLIRGVLLLLFTALFAFGFTNFFIILGLQVILSLNAAFFDPCIPAVIPRIVGSSKLSQANAMHQTAAGIALIGGAALGGLAVAVVGYVWIFFLNGLSFLFSACFEMFIRIPKSGEGKVKTTLVSDIKAGYAYLFNSRSLVVILFMVAVIHFFVGGIEVFMPVIAHGMPNGGPKTLGFFQAALGSGTLLMSLVLARTNLTSKVAKGLFTSVMTMGGIQVLSWVCPMMGTFAWVGYSFCFVLWGAAMVRAAVCFRTLIQQYTKESFSGRVFALASTLGNASIPAAMIMFGILTDHIETYTIMPLSGVILIGLGAISLMIFKGDKT
ncbi:MAG: MFS transporter [Desulfobacterales bacterium]|nr:MFS transporter [Desulfobacterales bacterium]